MSLNFEARNKCYILSSYSVSKNTYCFAGRKLWAVWETTRRWLACPGSSHFPMNTSSNCSLKSPIRLLIHSGTCFIDFENTTFEGNSCLVSGKKYIVHRCECSFLSFNIILEFILLRPKLRLSPHIYFYLCF